MAWRKTSRPVHNGGRKKKRHAKFMGGMIVPPQPCRKQRKIDEAKARGVDLANEVEHAMQVLGKFREGMVNSQWDAPNVERTDQATWKNVAREVEQNIVDCFRISETIVRQLVPPQRSRTLVAKKHRLLVAVQHRKIQRAAPKANIDRHFSCRLMKSAIERTIGRGGTVVHTDNHATWELTSGMFQKQPVVAHNEQFKTAPYSDSSPIIGMMKCVANSMLFSPPVAKAPVPGVSQKYDKPMGVLILRHTLRHTIWVIILYIIILEHRQYSGAYTHPCFIQRIPLYTFFSPCDYFYLFGPLPPINGALVARPPYEMDCG